MIALAVVALIQTQPINLQCTGVSNANGQWAARALVEINGEAVRVQAPSGIFATVTGRRQDQWRELTDVTITERAITGRHSPNLFSRMEVIINRMTGDIQITVSDITAGGSSFRGDCEVVADTPLF